VGDAFEPLHSLIALISTTAYGLTGNALPRPAENQAYGIMRSTFGKSASETSTVPPRWRLVFFSFDVKMWRIFVWPRSTLPVPVFLKRFAAPLCVFSLGMDILKIAGMATSASIPEPRHQSESLFDNPSPAELAAHSPQQTPFRTQYSRMQAAGPWTTNR